MATEQIVKSIFGPTPLEIEQANRERVQGLYSSFGQMGGEAGLGGVLGVGLGRLARTVFDVKDPELTKAKDIASIQKELLTELGPTGISDPNKFFPLLSEKLQNAGYSDEATQISIVGANEIANWNKEQKALEIQDLQIKQGQQSLKTEIELLEERKESAIREGNIPLALRLEAELNKKLPKQKEVKLEAPQTIADRAILKSFQNDYGEVEGGKKFNEYKNKLEVNAALAKKSKDDGLSINELVKINKEVKSIVKPSVDRIKKYMDITSILDLARQGNADANAQLDRFLTTLVGDKQIGAKEVAQVVSGGSLPRRVGNSISQWLTGEKTELAYEDKDALVRELLDKAINDNELAFKSAKYQYGDLLTEKQMDQALAGLRYNRSKSPETSEELSDEELLQKYINE
jgi:hypothetical protein